MCVFTPFLVRLGGVVLSDTVLSLCVSSFKNTVKRLHLFLEEENHWNENEGYANQMKTI